MRVLDPMRRALRICALLMVGLCQAPGGQAATACPNESDPEFQGRPLVEYQRRLQGFVAQCGKDAEYLAWHGVVLKWLGQYAQAAEWLELALMRAPERLGIQVDYAEVLVAMGDIDAGRALVARLLAEPSLPASLRPQLEARLAAWSDDAWLFHGSLTTRAGYDNNLNSATRARELSLSLPEGDVGFILGPGSRARPGAFAALELAGDAERRISGRDSLQLMADLKVRHSGESDTDYLQGELNALWRRRAIDFEHQWVVGGGNLAYDGRTLYRVGRLGYFLESRQPVPFAGGVGASLWGAAAENLGGCRPRYGGELEFRNYPGLASLDNTLLAAQLGYLCHGSDAMRAQIRFGHEFAGANRPGGDAWRIDSRIIWRHPVARGWLESDVSLAWQRDESAYSPLLAGGARRYIERFGLRLEYQQPLADRWLGLVTLDLGKQYSNIELFAVNNAALSFGLRYAY